MPPASRVRPPTSADVAEHVGLSRATVSQILNGRGDRFLPETRERVQAAAAELSYRPSRAGRSLVRGRDDTIVVLTPATTFGPNLQDAVDQVTIETADLGANVVVRFAADSHEATVSAILTMQPWVVVNLGYLTTEDRTTLEAGGVAVVPRSGPTEPETSGSRTRHPDIVDLQLAALTANGPRRIAFAALSDGRTDAWGPARHASLSLACRAAGLPEPALVAVPLDLEGAVAALRQLTSDADEPLGLACYNDDVAIAALAAAGRLGLRVPEDLAVVGMDAHPLGQLWNPRLTSVEFDIRALMTHAVADLLQGTPHEKPRPAAVQLARLVQGDTT